MKQLKKMDKAKRDNLVDWLVYTLIGLVLGSICGRVALCLGHVFLVNLNYTYAGEIYIGWFLSMMMFSLGMYYVFKGASFLGKKNKKGDK